jgi:hypothetical protein
MKRAAVALLILLVPLFSVAQTKTVFDKFKNLTHISTEETQTGNVTYGGGKDASLMIPRMGMIVGFRCPGQAQHCKPSIIEVLFTAYTSDWTMNGNNHAIFLIDGKPLSAGHAEWDGQVIDVDSLMEFNDLNIGPVLFRRLAGAKSIDVQIGSFEFSLTDANLAAIKDIASHAE